MFNTFGRRRGSSKDRKRANWNFLKIKDTPEKFMVCDGEIKFSTGRCTFLNNDFKTIKSKKGNSNKQMPIWYEAFVLYYDKNACS